MHSLRLFFQLYVPAHSIARVRTPPMAIQRSSSRRRQSIESTDSLCSSGHGPTAPPCYKTSKLQTQYATAPLPVTRSMHPSPAGMRDWSVSQPLALGEAILWAQLFRTNKSRESLLMRECRRNQRTSKFSQPTCPGVAYFSWVQKRSYNRILQVHKLQVRHVCHWT